MSVNNYTPQYSAQNYVYRSLDDFNAVKKAHDEAVIPIAEQPDSEFKAHKANTKLTVFENPDGYTIAGKSCHGLDELNGYASFYVGTLYGVASYTVFFKNGKASEASRTLKRSPICNFFNSLSDFMIGNTDGTGKQLVDYLNYNINAYSHQKKFSDTEVFTPFHPNSAVPDFRWQKSG